MTDNHEMPVNLTLGEEFMEKLRIITKINALGVNQNTEFRDYEYVYIRNYIIFATKVAESQKRTIIPDFLLSTPKDGVFTLTRLSNKTGEGSEK